MRYFPGCAKDSVAVVQGVEPVVVFGELEPVRTRQVHRRAHGQILARGFFRQTAAFQQRGGNVICQAFAAFLGF